MSRSERLMGGAGLLMAVNAGLHVLAVLPGWFSELSLMLVPIGLVYALFAWGLWEGWGWLAYIVFLVVLVGAVAAYAFMGSPGLPAWWLGMIIVVDLAVAVMLFERIWRGAPAKP